MKQKQWSQCSFAVLICSLVLSASGCSRSFWRSQADFDALNLLENKQFDPRWDVPRTTVEADPRSRFYDPYDLDCEPLPPDDPSANQYMSWLYGMRGYKSWHRFGESMSVENPQWLAGFGIQPDRFHDVFRTSDGITDVPLESLSTPEKDAERLVPTIENLTLGQAIELSSIHSRDYQTQLENLFLSALQLSLDQFQFNVRYLAFSGKQPTGTETFSTTPGGASSMLFANQGGAQPGPSHRGAMGCRIGEQHVVGLLGGQSFDVTITSVVLAGSTAAAGGGAQGGSRKPDIQRTQFAVQHPDPGTLPQSVLCRCRGEYGWRFNQYSRGDLVFLRVHSRQSHGDQHQRRDCCCTRFHGRIQFRGPWRQRPRLPGTVVPVSAGLEST